MVRVLLFLLSLTSAAFAQAEFSTIISPTTFTVSPTGTLGVNCLSGCGGAGTVSTSPVANTPVLQVTSPWSVLVPSQYTVTVSPVNAVIPVNVNNTPTVSLSAGGTINAAITGTVTTSPVAAVIPVNVNNTPTVSLSAGGTITASSPAGLVVSVGNTPTVNQGTSPWSVLIPSQYTATVSPVAAVIPVNVNNTPTVSLSAGGTITASSPAGLFVAQGTSPWSVLIPSIYTVTTSAIGATVVSLNAGPTIIASLSAGGTIKTSESNGFTAIVSPVTYTQTVSLTAQPTALPVSQNAGPTVKVQGTGDPCMGQVKLNSAMSTSAASATIVTGNGVQKIYLCSVALFFNGATLINLVETTPGTSILANATAPAVFGSNTTAASGASFAANSGIQLGSGAGTVAQTTSTGSTLRIWQSGTALIGGNVTYVQQ